MADDLTGAADAAAAFAVRGAETSVCLRWPPRAGYDVVARVADIRSAGPVRARAATARTVEGLRDLPVQRLFVKVDSTLRGQVLAQTEGASAAWPGPVLACPAFPAQQRTVVEGHLVVNDEVRPGPVRQFFPPHVEVRDAADDAALRAVARHVVAAGAVAVGSAGLAAAVAAELWAAELWAARPTPPRVPRPAVRGVLVVAGSGHPATLAQLGHLRRRGAETVYLDAGPPAWVPAAAEWLRARRDVVVVAAVPDRIAIDSPAAHRWARRLAEAACRVLDHAPGAGLVLTGGETALAVCRLLRARELRVLGEVVPGVPHGVLCTRDRRLAVVTKAGGFGRSDLLGDAVEVLREAA